MKIEIIGQRFGSLTVLSFSHMVKTKSYFLCLCDCGFTKSIRRSHLITGNNKSCGCMRSINISKAVTRHGNSVAGNISKEYISWRAMKERCLLKSNAGYHNYGDRGITVCKQWINDFDQFLKDMGPRPDGCSIERIDNSRGYSPDNCRWANGKEQANNKRNNRPITYKGKTQTITQWAECIKCIVSLRP